MAQTPLPEEIENWVRFQIKQLNPGAERTVQAYLERHGLSELPLPEYVSADMCYVYKPQRDAAKQIIGYSKVPHRGLPESLLIALEKDFLLAPPVAQASETAVEVASGPDSRAAQATPFDETKGSEPAEDPEQTETPLAEASDEDKEGVQVYKCERRWARNNKLCGREYKTKGRLLAHIKKSHSSEG